MNEIAANLGVNLGTIYEWITRNSLTVPKPRWVLPFRSFEAGCGVRRLAVMNLAVRRIEADFGIEQGTPAVRRFIE